MRRLVYLDGGIELPTRTGAYGLTQAPEAHEQRTVRDDGDGGALACEDARRVYREVMGTPEEIEAERLKRERELAAGVTPKRSKFLRDEV